MILAILLVGLFGAWGGSVGHAATRLGLHVTAEELAIWQARVTDNVNTINGFTYKAVWDNRIAPEATTFKNATHPGADGWWAGVTGQTGCVRSLNNGAIPGLRPGRDAGLRMMKAAFYFLVTGDVTYANPIRTELLSQITQTAANWANSAKWCPYNGTGSQLTDGDALVPVVLQGIVR